MFAAQFGTIIEKLDLLVRLAHSPHPPSSLFPSFHLSRPENPRIVHAVIMSRLNANAFSFVPGQGFNTPQQPAQPQPPPPAPLERPEQTEAPRPAPTISLNIGGAKPAAPPAAPAPAPEAAAPAPAAAPPVPAPTTSAPPPKPAPATSSKTEPAASSTKAKTSAPNAFTLERAKNDTTAVAQEVKASVDEDTLKDLYGNSASLYHAD